MSYKILIEHLKKYEGCRLKAYRDPAGILTIGYGHTGADVHVNDQCTQEHADALLDKDATDAMQAALKRSPTLKDATDYQRAAIASFVYNCGINAYRRSSLRYYVDNGQWNHAASEMRKWVHAGGEVIPGLVKRRDAESAMLVKDI